MNKILLLFFAGLALAACKKEENQINAPSNVSNATVQPRVGGAVVKWTLPKDSNFLYVEVRYMRKGQVFKTNVSKYTDSILYTDLLNKLDYTFEIQPFNRNLDKIIGGSILTTGSVKPIKRPVQITYSKIPVTNAMIDTYTQETSEGPKANLVDGNTTTYWHSAWSSGVQPLPHWVKITSPTDLSLSQIRYYFRNNTSVNGRPTQIALETSTDGNTWTREWTSAAGLITSGANTQEQVLNLDKPYTSKFFRIMFLATTGNTTYVTLGEMSFYKQELTDLEALAEKNY